MIRKHVNLLFITTLALFAILSGSSKALIQNGEPGISNILMLNGKVTDENTLSWETTGKLSLGTLHTEAGKPGRISFYAYVIRAGKIVDTDAFAHNNAVTEIEMSDILKSAKEGDQIIIDPAGENPAKNRRVIAVRKKRYTPQFNLWPGQIAVQKDGC